jgi:hypothetical protein
MFFDLVDGLCHGCGLLPHLCTSKINNSRYSGYGGDLIYTASIVIKSTATTIYEKAFKNEPSGGQLRLTTGKKAFREQASPVQRPSGIWGK